MMECNDALQIMPVSDPADPNPLVLERQRQCDVSRASLGFSHAPAPLPTTFSVVLSNVLQAVTSVTPYSSLEIKQMHRCLATYLRA